MWGQPHGCPAERSSAARKKPGAGKNHVGTAVPGCPAERSSAAREKREVGKNYVGTAAPGCPAERNSAASWLAADLSAFPASATITTLRRVAIRCTYSYVLRNVPAGTFCAANPFRMNAAPPIRPAAPSEIIFGWSTQPRRVLEGSAAGKHQRGRSPVAARCGIRNRVTEGGARRARSDREDSGQLAVGCQIKDAGHRCCDQGCARTGRGGSLLHRRRQN